MSKITLIHFVPGDHIALTPHAIMKHLGAQVIHDFGSNANPSPAAVRDLIRLARRNKHVAVLTLGDNSVQETLNRLIKRDDLAIDVQHTSYSLIAGQILHVKHLQKSIPSDLSELELRIIAMYGNPLTAAEIQLKVEEWRKQNPQLAFYGGCMAAEFSPTGRRKDTGEHVPHWPTPTHPAKTAAVIVHGPQGCGKTRNARTLAEKLDCDVIQDGSRLDIINHRSPPRRSLFLVNSGVDELVERLKRNAVSRGEDPEKLRIEVYEFTDVLPEFKTATYRFPHVPVDFEVPHKKAHIRGVAHGATMYAMGLVEGMAIGDRYITLIVNGDEDVKKIFIDYPFINWDSGRIQVRTVSEVLMVSAEDKTALGYAEWVADVTPDNLKALLELDQWQHFVGFLSGYYFDQFTKEYSQ